jgi:hypothetical protein
VKCLGTPKAVGLERPKFLEVEMDRAMRNYPEQDNCTAALKDMKEERLFPKERRREWDTEVREKFRYDDL